MSIVKKNKISVWSRLDNSTTYLVSVLWLLFLKLPSTSANVSPYLFSFRSIDLRDEVCCLSLHLLYRCGQSNTRNLLPYRVQTECYTWNFLVWLLFGSLLSSYHNKIKKSDGEFVYAGSRYLELYRRNSLSNRD